MHISRVVIRNYRNFRSAVFLFHKGINAIVGENGSGKTNALQAIRLLLDEDLARRALRLHESDFNRALGDWRGHWIVISIDFEELDPSEGCQIIGHQAAHHAGDPQTGTYTFIFRPRYQTRHDLHELSANGTRDQVEERLAQITLDEYEPILMGRATADFVDDAVYTHIVGNHNICQFPNPDDDDALLLGTSAYGIDREISLTFAKALRDVVDDLRGYRDNPLLNLLRGAGGAIEVGHAEALLTQVSNLNTSISQLSEVRRIGKGLANTLLRTVGTTYAPQLDLMSSLPSDM